MTTTTITYINDDYDCTYLFKGLLSCVFQSVESEKVVIGTCRYIGGFLCYAYTRYTEKKGIFKTLYRISWVPVVSSDYNSILEKFDR